MTIINYTVDRRRGAYEYKGIFEATAKPTNSELIDELDRNNFGGSVKYIRQTGKENVYESNAEVWVN